MSSLLSFLLAALLSTIRSLFSEINFEIGIRSVKPQAVAELSLLLLLRPRMTNAMESSCQEDTVKYQSMRPPQEAEERLPSGAVISFSDFALLKITHFWIMGMR